MHYQFDPLYVPQNVFKENTYKCLLPGVDFASGYKVTRALKTKKAIEVAFVLEAICKKDCILSS